MANNFKIRKNTQKVHITNESPKLGVKNDVLICDRKVTEKILFHFKILNFTI